MVTAKSGFTWRPERPNAPTFVEQKARATVAGLRPACFSWLVSPGWHSCVHGRLRLCGDQAGAQLPVATRCACCARRACLQWGWTGLQPGQWAELVLDTRADGKSIKADKDGKKVKANIWLSYLRSYEVGPPCLHSALTLLPQTPAGAVRQRGRLLARRLSPTCMRLPPHPPTPHPTPLVPHTPPTHTHAPPAAAHGRGSSRVPQRLQVRAHQDRWHMEGPGVVAADPHVPGEELRSAGRGEGRGTADTRGKLPAGMAGQLRGAGPGMRAGMAGPTAVRLQRSRA